MNRKILAAAALLSLATAVQAADTNRTEKGTDKEGRGAYAAIELSTGSVINRDRGLVTPDYAFKLAAGWRFSPRFTVAAGFEGINSIKAGCTSLPVFVQLRSDLLDRMVSPYIQVEAGWAFQMPQGNLHEGDILTNGDIFTQRLEGQSLEGYLSQFPEEERAGAEASLRRFSNGSDRYVSGREWNRRLVSKDGPYGNLTVGVALRSREGSPSNVFFGVTAGIASYYEGLYVRTLDNRNLRFGLLEEMPGKGRGDAVTEGRPEGWGGRYRGELRFKIGFCF